MNVLPAPLSRLALFGPGRLGAQVGGVLIVGTLALGALAGCQPTKSDHLVTSGPALVDVDCLRPNSAPGTQAVLRLAGTRIPVELHCQKAKGEVTLRSVNKGATIDKEIYQSNADGFFLTYAGGESFSPPLPLLQYPMRIGQAWQWAGDMAANAQFRSARATVSTSMAQAEVGNGVKPGVKVRVTVQMLPEAGANAADAPVERELQFWIVEGHGVVRREFGQTSIREPARVIVRSVETTAETTRR
ncbi:MAG: hypothetical protein SFX74_10235 [Fimbriimonadaceae bacterium]|nr:hypothetical protein [Fimbriimonadaceae bacterium]